MIHGLMYAFNPIVIGFPLISAVVTVLPLVLATTNVLPDADGLGSSRSISIQSLLSLISTFAYSVRGHFCESGEVRPRIPFAATSLFFTYHRGVRAMPETSCVRSQTVGRKTSQTAALRSNGRRGREGSQGRRWSCQSSRLPRSDAAS